MYYDYQYSFNYFYKNTYFSLYKCDETILHNNKWFYWNDCTFLHKKYNKDYDIFYGLFIRKSLLYYPYNSKTELRKNLNNKMKKYNIIDKYKEYNIFIKNDIKLNLSKVRKTINKKTKKYLDYLESKNDITKLQLNKNEIDLYEFNDEDDCYYLSVISQLEMVDKRFRHIKTLLS